MVFIIRMTISAQGFQQKTVDSVRLIVLSDWMWSVTSWLMFAIFLACGNVLAILVFLWLHRDHIELVVQKPPETRHWYLSDMKCNFECLGCGYIHK